MVTGYKAKQNHAGPSHRLVTALVLSHWKHLQLIVCCIMGRNRNRKLRTSMRGAEESVCERCEEFKKTTHSDHITKHINHHIWQ